MNRLIVIAASVSLSLAGLGVATAQENGVQGITTNADGSYVTSTAGTNPTANGEGGTIIYGDITTGPGNTVIGPPSIVTEPAPAPAPVVEPAPETVAAPVAEPVAAAPAADTAVATATDGDADNMADSLEWDLGLDPYNADSDADGVADGDEINIYGTEPTIFDTDGDGISDGEELFGIQTDPLAWDDFSAPAPEAAAQSVSSAASDAPAEYVQAQETSENVTATDGDAAALGTGNASAAPGSVTRGVGGTALLGPDGTYSVTDNAPPVVNVTGDTDVLTIVEAAPSSVAACGSYTSWYDAQLAYEAAGLTAADPALVSTLDPDYDGIACEEGM